MAYAANLMSLTAYARAAGAPDAESAMTIAARVISTHYEEVMDDESLARAFSDVDRMVKNLLSCSNT